MDYISGGEFLRSLILAWLAATRFCEYFVSYSCVIQICLEKIEIRRGDVELD